MTIKLHGQKKSTNKQTNNPPKTKASSDVYNLYSLAVCLHRRKRREGEECLGYFRVAQWRNQGMMMLKMKFSLNIKPNVSVMSSVQLSDIRKVDAVEIQYIQFCNMRQTILCVFCLKNLFPAF